MDKSLEAKRLRGLFHESKLQTFGKRQVFQTSEDRQHLNLMVSGFVKRYFIAGNGSLGVQAIYGADDIFPLSTGFTALLEKDNYPEPEIYYYETMTPVRLFTILSTDRLMRRVDADPIMYKDLFRNAGIRLHSNTQFLENLRLRGAYCKTAHQLCYFGYRFGKNTAAGTKIKLPLTHQDIADIIGTTRETVTASIIKLRGKKLINTGRNIVILDFEKLLDEAYS
jgi:CRP/FNR family transcriptional regulator